LAIFLDFKHLARAKCSTPDVAITNAQRLN